MSANAKAYRCRCSYPYGPHTLNYLLKNPDVNPPERPTVRIRDVGEPGYARIQFAPGFPSNSLDYDELEERFDAERGIL